MTQSASSGSPTAGEDGSKTASPNGNSRFARLSRMLLWLVFPLTLALAINRQSLWIDEGFTAWFASHRSIGSFFSALIGAPGAPGDPQLILYLLYIWSWIKFFGKSELALRAANIPFAILFIGTMSWASRRLLRRPNLWVYFCLSPFFWFYLNDARPYVALMGLSSVASVALLAYLIYPDKYKTVAPWCCLIALLLAWGMHIMAAFLFPTMILLVVLTAMGEPGVRRCLLDDWTRAVLFCAPAFVALGVFYVWVSKYGVNKGHGKPGLSNLLYALYEFTGFGGLGPPRNDIREYPHFSVFAPYWPLLLLGAIPLISLFFSSFRMPPPKIVLSLSVSLLVGVAVALVISMAEDFQILGRHMAAFFPLFLMTPMFWLTHSSFSSRPGRQSSVAVLVMLGVTWGISDARLVFLNKYGKDSYREASSIALARARSDDGQILWAADPYTAYYYGIQLMKDQHPVKMGKQDGLDWPVKNQAGDARNWTADETTAYLDASTTPTILVLGKADPFDQKEVWRALVREQKPTELARLTALTIYEWQPPAAKHSPAK